MALLGAAIYDPAVRASKATTSLLAMTAVDTTNLRVVFTAPANGSVLVRLRCGTSGATTSPQILLGILEGSTIKARVRPLAARSNANANAQQQQEAIFVVTGLTPGNSYTWDAAYGVEFVVAATGIAYGGPNNNTQNDAAGAFTFEVWDTPHLLGAKLYDPASAVAKSCASAIAMTALDTTNLRLTFTCPGSGKVLVHMRCMNDGATNIAAVLFGILDGATVRARHLSGGWVADQQNPLATSHIVHDASFVITGLTPGNSYTFDAAYGVEQGQTSSNLRYGGPDNTTQDDAYGGFAYEIWAA